MPTIEQIIDSISTVLHPTPFGQLPPSVTYKGVKVPHWEFFVNNTGHAQDRIDSALSSANGILNFVLGPVRSFVGAVLHPVVSLIDQATDLLAAFARSIFDRAVDLAYSAADTLSAGVGWAIGTAQGFANDVRGWAAATINALGAFLAAAINAVKAEAENLYNQAVGLAHTVADAAYAAATALTHAVGTFLGGLIDGVRRDAVAWFNDAKNFAVQGLADLRQWATDAVKAVEGFAVRAATDLRNWAETAIRDAVGAVEAALRLVERDIIDPLLHELRAFIDVEWKAARELLHVLEDAAEWIIFVTAHVVPEVKGLYAFGKGLASMSRREIISSAVGFARAA